jgi:hypothetical protein
MARERKKAPAQKPAAKKSKRNTSLLGKSFLFTPFGASRL